MTFKFTRGRLNVGHRMMASGSGGGQGGPPKPHIIIRMWNWIKDKFRRIFK